MNLEVKNIELIHKDSTIPAVSIETSAVDSVDALMTATGQPVTLTLKDFPYQSVVKVSYLKIVFPLAAVIAPEDKRMEILTKKKDFASVKFMDVRGRSCIFALPWLGENEEINEALQLGISDKQNIRFICGFNIF